MPLFHGTTDTFAALAAVSSTNLRKTMSRFRDTCACLGCLVLLYPTAFIIYFMVGMFKIYGPILMMIVILIFLPYAIIKSMKEK